jgi:hypothetical protein
MPAVTESQIAEGIDSPSGSGWDEYPLDSVFVRTESRTVGEVVKRINADRYELNPEFQRDFVWPADKQSRLIESCLMRIPLPVLYVAEAKDGRIIVVDGLQRLTTFKRYLGDEFPLTGLASSEDEAKPKNALEGLRFSELPLNLRERIEDTNLTLYILDAKAPERAKLDIFERVNGGVPLTRQQMRNCLYNGPATRWLKSASELDTFLKVTGGSLDRRSMRDREAINRFCAFYLLGEDHYRGDMDGFLASSLEKINQQTSSEIDALTRAFDISMRANGYLFKRHAFRKSLALIDDNAARSVINISLFDVCGVLFAKAAAGAITNNATNIRLALTHLLGDERFNNAITYSTNSTRQVITRFRMAREALKGFLL